jgi:predicted alpha/beta superfamily hydrolase
MKHYLFILLTLLSFRASSQYTLKLVVSDVATKKLDDIYVSGSFNNWKENDPAYKMQPFGGSRKVLVLRNMPAGTYQFKFLRSLWTKVETTAKGEDIPNREVVLNSDQTIDVKIPGWKDDYPDKPKPFTATAQVKLLDSVFAVPQLNTTRRIWIYLPKSYAVQKGKNYPVLYMNDGQNIFNERTAANGEWGVDEALDSLQKQTGKECIVVGIDNSSRRMNEYNPYNNDQFGKGDGDAYVRFIAETLKPFIDKQYRTLKGPKFTAIAGSSMGGVISEYAVLKYPQVFGAAGVFSPAFQVAPQLYDEAKNRPEWGNVLRFYFYAGGRESTTMIPDMDRMIDVLQAKHNYDVIRLYYPLGEHKEEAWRKYFPSFYTWLSKSW